MARAKKRWSYSQAGNHRVGLMICASCHKPIERGAFRYRDAGDRYITQHRNCCSDDPAWALGDAAEAKWRDEREALRQACIEFRSRWGVSELDEIIGEPC